jgi:hypothetical protein
LIGRHNVGQQLFKQFSEGENIMRCVKYFGGLALAAGMLAAGTSIAAAQERRYSQPTSPYQYQGQYYGNVYYSGSRYDRIEELQEHIARDRARLDEAIRCGREAEAARQAGDLARDQWLLQDQMRAVGGFPHERYYRPQARGWSLSLGWR